MKKINHLISALIMAAMTAGFASCSSSDEPSSVSDNTPKELTITIKTQGVTTKAAETNDPGTTKENTMNRITIGIFDASGNVRAIQEFSKGTNSSTDGIAGSTNFYYNSDNKSATATVVTTNMATSDKILVAVNAKAGTFAGISNVNDFRNKKINATEALYTLADGSNPSDNKAVNDNIPMFGESSTITQSSSNFSTSIQVKHITAKVTLDELKVDFAADGPYSAATFTPTEIFMYDVPDGVMFNTIDQCSSSTFLEGETTATSPSSNCKNFLSSEDLSGSPISLSGSNSLGTDYFFYVTPNDGTDTSGKITKLIIKGEFDPDGSGSATKKTVYYPVRLNYEVRADGTTGTPSTGGTKFVVSPNKNYKCKVTIKTIGSSGPNVDIDPTTAEITINVAKFDDVSQETVFQ